MANDIDKALWIQWMEDCQRLGLLCSEEQRRQLARFYDLLLETNRHTNLTRITAPEDFLYRHLLDSLTLAPLIPPGAQVADIGSGAGFPAIPLAIVRPDLHLLAVESVGKKAQFIQRVQEHLKLENLQVSAGRSETLGRQSAYRERFDVVTARAVAALPALMELCLPLLKVGGVFLAMKGVSYEPELQAAEKALKTLGGWFIEAHAFEHPRLAGSRVLRFEKTAPTPKAYPRTAGLPAKKPL